MAQPKVSRAEALEDFFKVMAGPPDTRPEIPEDGCIMCAKPSKTRCGRCKAVHYCSSGCQREDFKLHSKLCKGWTAFLATRPTDLHRLIIDLPQDETEPSLRWLLCTYNEVDDDGTKFFDFDYNNMSASIMPGHIPQPVYIRGNDKRGYRCTVGKNPWLFCGMKLVSRGLPANKCIFALTDGDIDRPWAGPVVIMGRINNGNEIRDVDLGDFRIIIDRHKAYNVLHLKASSPLPKGYVRGVKIGSFHDLLSYGWAMYTPVAVRTKDAVFRSSKATKPKLPALLGLPLLLREARPTFTPLETDIPHTDPVMMPLKQEQHSADLSILKWRNEHKTHIIVRQNRKDLTVNQISALSHYAQKLQTCQGNVVAASLTPEAFELFASVY